MANDLHRLWPERTPVFHVAAGLVIAGAAAFAVQVIAGEPRRAWQAFLINFLLWSSVAQGALLFSVVMHLTGARWSGALSGVAEAFAAFFPVSFLMFFFLAAGRHHVFPWLGADLHGKEVWLNLPFLLLRDGIGLAVLYGLGLGYVCNALGDHPSNACGKRCFPGLGRFVPTSLEKRRRNMTVLGVLYALAFALVLSLIGYDLVMSADPHWYSTLFGGYAFVKAFYVGLGGVILLAAALKLLSRNRVPLAPEQFHDIGKLFFGFCLVWADFFYCQFVVIWYGNIPEETAYVIARTMQPPYQHLAWTVLIACFLLPFGFLLNKKIKTRPWAMILLCALVLVGIWLEHLLLLGPSLSGHGPNLPLGLADVLVFLGFAGIMVLVLGLFLNRYPWGVSGNEVRRGA